MAPFETLRNIAWTGFLLSVLRASRTIHGVAERERAAAVGILGAILLVQFVVDVLIRPDMMAMPLGNAATFALVLRIMAAVSILLLIHNLYLSATPSKIGRASCRERVCQYV